MDGIFFTSGRFLRNHHAEHYETNQDGRQSLPSSGVENELSKNRLRSAPGELPEVGRSGSRKRSETHAWVRDFHTTKNPWEIVTDKAGALGLSIK
jgi:hypothetical protein